MVWEMFSDEEVVCKEHWRSFRKQMNTKRHEYISEGEKPEAEEQEARCYPVHIMKVVVMQ